MKWSYITLRSVTFAQRGETVLRSGGVDCMLQRTPHWMEEQGCGYCLRIRESEILEAIALLKAKQVPYRKIYVQTENGITEWRMP